MNARISTSAQKAFWETLNNELDALALESSALPKRVRCHRCQRVVVAAQATIVLYQLTIDGGQETPVLRAM
jgi:hypothetical protein